MDKKLKLRCNLILISYLKVFIKSISNIFGRIKSKILLEIDIFFYLKNGKRILYFFEKKQNKKRKIYASFTQTYGNERSLEIKLLKYDHIGRYMRDKCKYIVFSFRDCSESSRKNSIKFLEEIFPKEKLVFIVNNSVTYKESLLGSFRKIKSLGVTDIVLMQDDMYGLNNLINKDYQEIIDSIFSGYNSLQLKWLHLHRSETLNPDKFSLEEVKIGRIKFYKYCTKDFKKYTNLYSWDDGTFIADIEFLLELYLNIGTYVSNSPWLTEYLIKQLMDKYKFARYGINEHLFDSALIHGRHTVASEYLSNHLFQFFPNDSNKSEFVSLIKKSL